MCLYRFQDGNRCQLPDAGKGLCFWHDPTESKSRPGIKQELEELAQSGHNLEGFSLARADLQGINLVRHGHRQGFNLRRCDFYRCNLSGAHLFHADLSEASLMKANLNSANLHFANLENANLLGIKLDEAKIENVNWGQALMHEVKAQLALKQKQSEQANAFFQQAEEICRHIRKASERQGLFELAGRFFHKEMIMRRYQMPMLSFQRCISKLVDIFCGYGEKPSRVVLFSMGFIAVCGLVYAILGIKDGGVMLQLSTQQSIWENSRALMNTLYYSVVTFTTLGYGDLVPIGWSRLVAALEAFVGSFTLALFVVVFVKKMTR